MDEKHLKEIEERFKALPASEWTYDEVETPFYNDIEGRSCGGGGTGLYDLWEHQEWEIDGEKACVDQPLTEHIDKPTVEFFYHAKLDIPALIVEVRRLREALRNLQEAEMEHDGTVEADSALCAALVKANEALGGESS